MKAMILAAGRGKRMQALTEHTPKPLLRVGKRTLIEWQLLRLMRAGVREVVINLGYLGEQIEALLGDGARYGVSIDYSCEPQTGLETAGGIIQALPMLGGAPFLLLNADVWCEVDLRAFSANREADCLAHLLLTAVPSWRDEGDFSLAGTRVIAGEKWVYCGIAVIEPRLLADEAPGVKPLAPLLHRAVAQGKVSGERYYGAWEDVGTPQRLAALQARF